MRRLIADMFAVPYSRTGLVLLVGLVTLVAGESAAKDCLVPFTVSVKRADGGNVVVATVSPSAHLAFDVYLAPGDSVMVDLDQNMHCAEIYPEMTVFEG